MEFKNIGTVLVIDDSPETKTIVTFIHPYQEVDKKATCIPEFKNKWFTATRKDEIRNRIYNLYKEPGESKIQFARRFNLKWEERHCPVTQCILHPPTGLLLADENCEE